MKLIKYYIWPFIVGILGIFTFFITMNIAYETLKVVASIPIIGTILLLNARILGVNIIAIESFSLGSFAAFALMNFCTKYDEYGDHHCYAKASVICGILYAVHLVSVIGIMYETYGLSLSMVSALVPYAIFGIMLLSGSKFE